MRTKKPPPLPDALARLFEVVREGIYIGTLGANTGSTLAANPYLKLMFGYAPDTDAGEVRPFDAERFVDPLARSAFVERLTRDGAVTDFLWLGWFPTFNLADTAITLGVLALLWASWRTENRSVAGHATEQESADQGRPPRTAPREPHGTS